MPLHLKERPIFMIGAERSGTTLVMALLGSHSRIAVPEVVWYYPRFYPYLHTYGDLSNEKNLRVLAEEMVFGLKTPFWGMKVNPRTIVDEVLELAPEKSFAGIYAGMHQRFANSVGKPRWGEKTPHNLYFVGPMHEDFPDAQFIYITRDGRDACADYLESSFGPTNIYCAANSWKRCWNAVKEHREPLRDKGLWLDVKYEELVREPEKVMRGVCDFLGEDYEEGMFDFYKTDLCKARGASRDHAPLGKPISDAYVGIYKDLLSPRAQQLLAGYAWPGNVRELDALLRRYCLLHEPVAGGEGAGERAPGLAEPCDDALLAQLLEDLRRTQGRMAAEAPGGAVGPESFPAPFSAAAPGMGEGSLRSRLEQVEQAIIRDELARCGHNRGLVASRLGISTNTLWRKLKGTAP